MEHLHKNKGVTGVDLLLKEAKNSGKGPDGGDEEKTSSDVLGLVMTYVETCSISKSNVHFFSTSKRQCNNERQFVSYQLRPRCTRVQK